MILLEEHDRPSLRYPWWKDESMKEIMMLESTRHMFGVTSSPNISNFILRAHAEREKGNMSEETYLALLYSFYVDDLLKSIKDIPTARLIKDEITRILAKGGFKICKWRSNIPEINDNPDPVLSSTQAMQSENANGETNQERLDTAENTTIEHRDQPKPEIAGSVCRPAIDSPYDHPNNLALPHANVHLTPSSLTTKEHPSQSSNSNMPPTNDFTAIEDEAEEEPEMTTTDLVNLLNNSWEAECAKDLVSGKEPTDKILGIGYCFETDMMNVWIGSKSDKAIVTKKDLLSFIASIYDPIGMVVPWVLEGKHIFQDISSPTIPWKSKLTKDIQEMADKWKKSIVHLKKLRISRWTNPLGLENSLCDLCIFCDSSKDGFGIVSYLRRYLPGGGGTKSPLVFS